MRVAIVDDESAEREKLRGYLQCYGTEKHIKMEIDGYENGDRLISEYRTVSDVVIFDIDMPGINGMDAARYIRKRDANVVILFVTNVAQYAINGYEVDAVDYIIKPIGYYDFLMKFQKAVRRLSQRQDHVVVAETLDGIQKMKVSDIRYVEVLAHYLIYHTACGNFKMRGSMKEHETELCAYNFTRVHKSYLVNLACIENIHGSTVTVAGEELPLGRVYRDRVVNEYFRYIRG